MRMKLIRQVKTIDYLNNTLFDECINQFFNDETFRIIDTQFRTECVNNEIHYIAFIVYEYSVPDEEEEFYGQERQPNR